MHIRRGLFELVIRPVWKFLCQSRILFALIVSDSDIFSFAVLARHRVHFEPFMYLHNPMIGITRNSQ